MNEPTVYSFSGDVVSRAAVRGELSVMNDTPRLIPESIVLALILSGQRCTTGLPFSSTHSLKDRLYSDAIDLYSCCFTPLISRINVQYM